MYWACASRRRAKTGAPSTWADSAWDSTRRRAKPTPKRAILTLKTNDIRADAKRLRDKGIRFASEIGDYAWGSVVTFEDSEGNFLKLMQPPKQARWGASDREFAKLEIPRLASSHLSHERAGGRGRGPRACDRGGAASQPRGHLCRDGESESRDSAAIKGCPPGRRDGGRAHRLVGEGACGRSRGHRARGAAREGDHGCAGSRGDPDGRPVARGGPTRNEQGVHAGAHATRREPGTPAVLGLR